ncbi:hypothetical protein GCM10011511_10930 [Puia dinghuensis]|uniref:Uncharacterized protein n=1 Tax=Puia dinghuensis TaxID=1792502 RepID=A0A8J2XPW2_9BACT|nr:hypothetical protein GCM10011511_10930 [Puia dinghuensis]
MQLGFVFEEPPVGDVDFYGACEKQGVALVVFDHRAVQQHFVKKGEVDVFNADAGVQVVGEPFCYARNQPGLNGWQVDKTPY